jgi:trehalose 6-phosphate synthase/phosphatase
MEQFQFRRHSPDKQIDAEKTAAIARLFSESRNRLLLLDYDGTLVPYNGDPSKALPDVHLLNLLKAVSSTEKNELVIISGRDKNFLDSVFTDPGVIIFAEHGSIFRINGEWDAIETDRSWKKEIRFIMQEHVISTPGTSLEEKKNSIVWHYRNAENGIAALKARELISSLSEPCTKYNLTIMNGRKIIEVKPSEYTKGTAIISFFDCSMYDFILAAGDDITDEDLFEVLPENAIRIHVGQYSETADYTVSNSGDFVNFLGSLLLK